LLLLIFVVWFLIFCLHQDKGQWQLRGNKVEASPATGERQSHARIISAPCARFPPEKSRVGRRASHVCTPWSSGRNHIWPRKQQFKMTKRSFESTPFTLGSVVWYSAVRCSAVQMQLTVVYLILPLACSTQHCQQSGRSSPSTRPWARTGK
jgi:hypothetical protein